MLKKFAIAVLTVAYSSEAVHLEQACDFNQIPRELLNLVQVDEHMKCVHQRWKGLSFASTPLRMWHLYEVFGQAHNDYYDCDGNWYYGNHVDNETEFAFWEPTKEISGLAF